MPEATVPTTTTRSQDGTTSHAWEDNSSQNAWDKAVQEDESGNIVVVQASADTPQARRKRQRMQDTSQRNRRVVRDMIRYVYVVIDASRWMRMKDPVLPRGTRMDATLSLLHNFTRDYYDQNPLGHLGFCMITNGQAEVLSALSSSRQAHTAALQSLGQRVASEPPTSGGEFSLQNGLSLAGRSLGHQPAHGSREIIVLTSALGTCDPGNLLGETLPQLKQSKIRVSCLALTAELHVCRQICESTGGTMGVLLDARHFRDWLKSQTVPPPRINQEGCRMVLLGFPKRVETDVPTIIGKDFGRIGYACPNCQARHPSLPTPCHVCRLPLVLAPHLSRSFHHLFPVAPFVETIRKRPCFACSKADSPNECPECRHAFCVDCDAYLHESLHNCPGCLCNG